MQEVQSLFASLSPGANVIYLVAIAVGLYLHYLVAKKNGRTTAASFADYWLVETPGLSIGTLVTLATAAGAVIKSGMLGSMDGYAIFLFGFGKAFFFDAVIQAPAPVAVAPAAAAPAPAPQKQAGFARIGMLMLLAILSGCAALGLVSPQTPKQSLAYAVNVHEGLARGLTNAVQTQAVSAADGVKVEGYLLQAQTGLKAARTSLDGCVVAGAPVATVPAVSASSAPPTLPGIAMLAVQSVACQPNQTAVDQLALVNSLLQQLAGYYASRGIKTQ